MSRLPVIYNPVARGGRSHPPRRRLERVGRELGVALEWWETAAPGHAQELARRAARDGCPVLAVWGGDGTYNEAARGLVDTETAMLLLPGGTTSVLAYELGVPRDPLAALASQLQARRRAMSLARTDRGELFLLMLSAGPDSTILTKLPESWKRYAGKVGVTVQAVLEFLYGRLPRFRVAVNGVEHSAAWCIVGNSRYYGGPFAATPGADPFSPGLETVVLTRHGRWHVVPFFFAIPRGRHLARAGVKRFLAAEVKLQADEEVPYQLDGDAVGYLPVVARASGERLWVLPPAGLQPVMTEAMAVSRAC